MYQTNGSGPQINPGLPQAPQPQSTYGMNPGGHAQTLADLVAQYRAKSVGPQVNPGPGTPQTPAQPAMSQFQQRRQQFRESGQHPMMSRLFGMYFK